jgi:hypothetical protein
LAAWRVENKQGSQDLTHQPGVFEWRGYLANHPDRTMFWAGGRRLCKFTISRLPAIMDTNTRDARVDFLLDFDDGTVIRLHPGSKAETCPVLTTRDAVRQICEQGTHDAAAPAPPRGNDGGGQGKGKGKKQGTKGRKGYEKGADWVAGWNARTGKGRGPPPLALTAPQGHVEQRVHFEGISQADLVPTHAVKQWAATRLAIGGPFTTDVTNPCWLQGWRTPRFVWYTWFAHEKKLQHFVKQVAEVWLVMMAPGVLGFWFCLDDGAEYVVKFAADGGVRVVDDPAVVRTIDWEA